MGLGDDLMITEFVEQEKKKHPNKQIVIGNLKEKIIYDSIIYKNNPNITPINKVNRDKPIHFIAKKELKKIPFIGWYVTAAGMIFIDRTNREKAMRSMKKAGTLIRNGRNVITFPEGTRSSNGKLNLFKRGSFIIKKVFPYWTD